MTTKHLVNYPSMLDEDFFNDLSKAFFGLRTSTQSSNGISSFMPKVNTREGEYAYHIEIDLPGVKKEDIKIETNNNALTISGERKYKNEVKEADYHRIESSYGKFQRSFPLPQDVDEENIKAHYENGMLEVIVPKKKQSSGRNISIQDTKENT
jgi:HSP20 family protein